MAQYLDILRKQITKAQKARELNAAGYSKKSITGWLTMSEGQYEQAIRGKAARKGKSTSVVQKSKVNPSRKNVDYSEDKSRQMAAIQNNCNTKSEKARQMAAIGISKADIARALKMSSGHLQEALNGKSKKSSSKKGSTKKERFRIDSQGKISRS